MKYLLFLYNILNVIMYVYICIHDIVFILKQKHQINYYFIYYTP